jgi:hypothetical protein
MVRPVSKCSGAVCTSIVSAPAPLQAGTLHVVDSTSAFVCIAVQAE